MTDPTDARPVAAGDEVREALQRARVGIATIKQATIDGKVCDDIAWMDEITTLHDYCDQLLDATDPAQAALTAPPSPQEGKGRERQADSVMREIWTEWFTFYEKHFRGPGIKISMADQLAFYEIAQPKLFALVATPPTAVTEPTCPHGEPLHQDCFKCDESPVTEPPPSPGGFPASYDDEVTAEQVARVDDAVRGEFATGNWQTVETEASPGGVERAAAAICDGFHNGNKQLDECDAAERQRFVSAALSASALRSEGERALRDGFKRICEGLVVGRVGGEDVVWFDEITTLFDFCDQFLTEEESAAIRSRTTTPSGTDGERG